MSARVFADTSALLAVANPRDQYHDRAVRLAREHIAAGGRFVSSVLVLAELHGHLLQRRGAGAAREVLTALLDDTAYEWEAVPMDLAREAVSAWLGRFGDQRFTLTDAASFAIMRAGRLQTAFAFDQHFAIAGFDLLA